MTSLTPHGFMMKSSTPCSTMTTYGMDPPEEASACEQKIGLLCDRAVTER